MDLNPGLKSQAHLIPSRIQNNLSELSSIYCRYDRQSHILDGFSCQHASHESILQQCFGTLVYSEMIVVNDFYVGFGTDYPYLWLKALPQGKSSVATHLALDAPG